MTSRLYNWSCYFLNDEYTDITRDMLPKLLPPVIQRRAISQMIKPKLQMSAIMQGWKWFLFRLSSSTSGAMQRLVPTLVFKGTSTSFVSLKQKTENVHVEGKEENRFSSIFAALCNSQNLSLSLCVCVFVYTTK